MVSAGCCYGLSVPVPLETGMAAVGNGQYMSADNGVVPDSGSSFYGYGVGEILWYRAGVTYVRFSDLGLGSGLQAGRYRLVMRVSSNGEQDWPGLRNMTQLDGGAGYAAGFFVTAFDSADTLAENGRAVLDGMVDFNRTPGVTCTFGNSPLTAPDPLPLGDNGMQEDTWYNVTSQWVIATDSSVVGTDPFIGVGFEVGHGCGGAVFVDDSVLSYESPNSLYSEWADEHGVEDSMQSNPDGDAFDNLAEYAFGGDPFIKDGLGLGLSGIRVAESGSNVFQMVYAARGDAQERGLTYHLGSTSNLLSGNWEEITTEVAGSGVVSTGFRWVSNQLAMAECGFVRLSAEFSEDVSSVYVPRTKKSLAKILGEYQGLSSLMGAEWYYNWGRFPGADAPSSLEFVPMVWGLPEKADGSLDAAVLRSRIQEALNAVPDCRNFLAFNEPDHTNQSNHTVEQVIEVWPVFEEELAGTGIRIGSPGVVSITNSDWLASFMSEVINRNYQVDFICVHRRISINGDPVNQLVEECKFLYEKYHKPIWITELELTGTGLTEADVVATWQEWADRLENDPSVAGIVERYAFAYAPPDTDIDYKIPARPFETNGALTTFGRTFQQLHAAMDEF